MLSPKNMPFSTVTCLVLTTVTVKELVTFDPQFMSYPVSRLPADIFAFEREGHTFVFMRGGRIGYFRGDIRVLSEEIKAVLKRTVLATVLVS